MPWCIAMGWTQSFQNNGVAIVCCGRESLLSPRRAVLAGDREGVDPVAGEGEALLGPGHSSRVEVPSGLTQLPAEAVSLSMGLSCVALGTLSPLHSKVFNNRIFLPYSEHWRVLCESHWGPFTLLSSRLVRGKLCGLPDNFHKRRAVKELFEQQNGWRWAWSSWLILCWLLINTLGSTDPKASPALPQWYPELTELVISTAVSGTSAEGKQSRWNGWLTVKLFKYL